MNENAFTKLRSMIEGDIPFLRDMGIKVIEMETGRVKLQLPHNSSNLNYIGTCHAGAIFTFGETAGGALAGVAFDIKKYYFVVKEANIKYIKPVTGAINCEISLGLPEKERITKEIEEKGKSSWLVSFSLNNEKNEAVAEMSINYVLKKREE